MIKKYILNFWVWWYGAKLREVLQTVYSFWSLSLANLNILAMLGNLFVPMFRDQSFTGRVVSIFLRLGWVTGGTVIQILITIPAVSIIVIWLVLPFLCIYQFIQAFFL
ncbi:MAG: hypothetical protein ABIE03_07850 [Patescibacteria group bacterium]|nr:hypothetical protein [Patescibacteria group bacterium]